MVPSGWQRSHAARAPLGVPQAAGQEWQAGSVKEEFIMNGEVVLVLCTTIQQKETYDELAN